jgi:hypothetical protein
MFQPSSFSGKSGPWLIPDLPHAFACRAEIHNQRAVTEQLPAGDVVAEHTPRRAPGVGLTHVRRTRG